MKVLFLVQTSEIGPASRYRVYQYLDYLKTKDIKATVSPAISAKHFFRIYGATNPWRKILYFIFVIIVRLKDIFRVKQYDVVFIQREILPQLFPVFEKIISILNKNIIFDFDDAIFLVPPQRHNFIYKFRCTNNIKEIIKMSKYVIAGNEYLKSYALEFNRQVSVIPTAIDTNKFCLKSKRFHRPDKITIGWIGTMHTLFYLENIKEVFKHLAASFNICLSCVGVENFTIEGVEVINKPWSIVREIADLQEFDIGVAPLLDDRWGKGKCGLKALQYMSCGIPVICSNAGVFKEIIQDGENGFLAENNQEWIDKLGRLIKDEDLRKRMSVIGRKTVEGKYSLTVNAPLLGAVLQKISLGDN